MANWYWYKEDGVLKLKREGDAVDFGLVRKTTQGTYWVKVLDFSSERTQEATAVERLEELLKTSGRYSSADDVICRIKHPTLVDVLKERGYVLVHKVVRTTDRPSLTLREMREVMRICDQYFSEHAETATQEELEAWTK